MSQLTSVLRNEFNPPQAAARRAPTVVNLTTMRRRNPLRMDPSRTTLIRRQFMAEMMRRMRELKAEIWQWLVVDDELGLTAQPRFRVNVNARSYEFLTSDRKLETFNEWLQTMIDGKVLGVAKGQDAWTAKYVSSAWRQGLNRAYIQSQKGKLGKSLDFMEGTKAQFLRQAFNQPELMSKVKLLGTRSFNDMEGLTRAMKTDLNRILADGLVNGRSARKVARDMYERIDGLTKGRALTIARTEIIHAQAEGQLDGMENLGYSSVTAEMEWSDSGDTLVCPRCAAMSGKTFTIDEARGMIPLHPNCRCAWIPVEQEPKAKAGKG